MVRMLAWSLLSAAVFMASAGDCLAKGLFSRPAQGSVASFNRAGGGLFARLNKPLVPGMPVSPGLPTASPLGLIAPRLSNAVSIFQFGGMGTQAGRLAALGVLSPRISPVVAMVRKPPVTRQAKMMYGLTILSPRAAVLVGMLQGFRSMPASFAGRAPALVR
ncbi:MAG: hypothetical protein WCC69_00210 [Pirellulales bacterium]